MALYEDDSMVLRNPGEAAPEGFVSKGMMGPEGQEQEYYERAKSPTVEQQPQAQSAPIGGDINKFLDWAIKKKLGFDPLTMNPVTDAMKTWSQNEAKFFNEAFAGTGMTPGSMTPDALKFWNEQKKQGMEFMLKEAQMKQRAGLEFLSMLKQGWEEQNTVAGKLELPDGSKALVNKFGQKIQNADAVEELGAGGMVAGPGAPSDKFLIEPAKKEKPPTSAEERKKYVDTQLLMKMTTQAESLLNKKESDEWIGPVAGRIGQIQEKITELPKDQIDLYATMRDINDFVLRVRSGAQINEQEYKRLTSFLTDPNLPKPTLKARLERFRNELEWMHGLVAKEMGKENVTKPSGKTPDLPAGWTRDASGNVFDNKGKKKVWRD